MARAYHVARVLVGATVGGYGTAVAMAAGSEDGGFLNTAIT